jgi:hypothetical protein
LEGFRQIGGFPADCRMLGVFNHIRQFEGFAAHLWILDGLKDF